MTHIEIVVPYDEIPIEARDLLDEIYLRDGAEIWWNARNRLLGRRRPREVELSEATNLLNAIAEGVFF